ncbi:hypothetical protein EYF80_047320 [Liparis tanakae]|uniref:Uncharacterized protein n=1 Tax=Liparis tanakae TaxID=230148 RepID=A0A4Z2FMN2_9TELE|nr:hypothetical protein EYF80_047320 [Liparis tanakae]
MRPRHSPGHGQGGQRDHGRGEVLHALVDHDAVDGLPVVVRDEGLACRRPSVAPELLFSWLLPSSSSSFFFFLLVVSQPTSFSSSSSSPAVSTSFSVSSQPPPPPPLPPLPMGTRSASFPSSVQSRATPSEEAQVQPTRPRAQGWREAGSCSLSISSLARATRATKSTGAKAAATLGGPSRLFHETPPQAPSRRAALRSAAPHRSNDERTTRKARSSSRNAAQ